jgi:hypothetical protein
MVPTPEAENFCHSQIVHSIFYLASWFFHIVQSLSPNNEVEDFSGDFGTNLLLPLSKKCGQMVTIINIAFLS